MSRHLAAALAATLLSAPAWAAPTLPSRPASGPTIPAAGLPLAEPPAAAHGTYHGDVFTLGNDDLIVVITEGPDAARPAHWTAVDRGGRVAWEADHACPNFDDYAILAADGDRLVCKLPNSILAVDAGDGDEVWRYRSDTTLYVTGVAGGRVATSVDNQQVLVLEAADGREVGRWGVDGSVLEAVTSGPNGPVGLMIVEPDDKHERQETLEVGGEKLELTVTLPSPDRRMGILPLGGPAWRGVRPMALRWSVPFEGYSYDLVDAGGVVVGKPREGVWEGYDLGTGRRLWERAVAEGETLAFGPQGGTFWRTGADGGFTTGAIAPRSGRDLWEHRWSEGTAPAGLGQGSGQVAAWSADHIVVDRFDDGTPLTELRLSGGRRLLAASTSPFAIVWVAEGDGGRRLYVRALTGPR